MKVTEERLDICGWPTDVLSIEHDADIGNESPKPTALILFVPGNPGVVHWYIDFLSKILQTLGHGYAVRGISYAGHGVGDEIVGSDKDHDCDIPESSDNVDLNNRVNKMKTAWTMDGQVKHKIEWIDKILMKSHTYSQTQTPPHEPNLIFISHSIGAHLVQCLLLERPDILSKTQHIIHLMPFFRFDPPLLKKKVLSTVAHNHELVIPVMTTAVRFASSTLSRKFVDLCMDKIAGVKCAKGRNIAVDVFLSPKMVRNHLVLGTEEMRDLPELPNDIALRLLSEVCSTSILFCDPDQWAPLFHMNDLQRMQARSELPMNIKTHFMSDLRHDFVVQPRMIDPIVKFCSESIKQQGTKHNNGKLKHVSLISSKL